MKFAVFVALFGGAIVAVAALIGRRKKPEPAPGTGAARTPAPKTSPPATAPEAAAGAATSNWLVGEEGEVKGKTFLIGARTITIGRGTTNFVQLNTEEASRVQCQIRSTPNGLLLTDMKSANGTFVNGARVREHVLKEGDVIRIGDAAMTYREKGDYGKDFGLGRKEAGLAQARETRFAGPMNWKSTIADALKANHGNHEVAAQQLGITVEAMHQLMKQHGLDG